MSTPQTTETITLPTALHAELSAYADHADADLGWVLRRAGRLLLDTEDEQAQRLAAKPPKKPTKRRKRATT